MLRALLEAGVQPDVVLGTSVGAINGAFVAADPSPATAERLTALWQDIAAGEVFSGSLFPRVGPCVPTGPHLPPPEPLRRMLADALGVRRVEDLAVPFQCVAASIERAAEHWFTSGPLADAVLASCAVPGLLAPVEIDGEHYLDGGLVHSIPVGRAVELGASTVYVLHAGRTERPLTVPTKPWEVALVAFEIARRHRFMGDIAALPGDLDVHVLPTGQREPPRITDMSQFRLRDTAKIADHIERAFEATSAYLDGVAA